ncbi:unnamed protein product [Rotaria sp. Silwood1]|nr:unnamed protein product [Rotaria sp. Silwood1]
MNLLVVTLWYLKHYHSERYIASELNFSQQTVNYCLSAVVDILHSCVYPAFVYLPADLANRRTPHGPQQHQKLIVDSTFIAIPEPHDSEQLVHVSECYYGSKHDITVLRESGLLEHVEESVQIIDDKVYIGEEYVVTPRKKPHGHELTQEDKDFNRDINSARAAIENINQRLNTYAILDGVYRGPVDDFHKITKIIQIVAALCNLNLNKHPIRR